jgi:phenylalanyl-tRNA synthetase alpha chain
MTLQETLRALPEVVAKELKAAASLESLEALEVRFLGRKGELAELMRGLKDATAEERPVIGALANEVKASMERVFSEARERLESGSLTERLESEREDITEPGLQPAKGHLHLMTQAIRDITDIFERAGFIRVRYPEVDWDWYAFEGLNMPKDHPARDDWETFFMDAPVGKKGKIVLTPHTSNAQVRELERHELPIRMINIAKCYRRESNPTHAVMFHQFEGLYVDKNVSIGQLTGVCDYFVREFFGANRKTRLRPHHFRFTEPSFEVDISCAICGGTMVRPDGQKCRVCKQGWVELGGAGMVHPNVLKAGGVDPSVYSGFAFGWGIERTYMMKEGLGVDDIRILYKNDLRFLSQF